MRKQIGKIIPKKMAIPKDKVEFGSGIRGWVNAIFYGTNETEVRKKVKAYYVEYDPRGYDTHTKKHPCQVPGKEYWWAHVVRYSSCD